MFNIDKLYGHFILKLYIYSGTPLVRPPFCIRKVASQEGWPLIRGRNQYIYVKIYIVKWSFLRGMASQKGGLSKGFPLYTQLLSVCYYIFSLQLEQNSKHNKEITSYSYYLFFKIVLLFYILAVFWCGMYILWFLQ